MVYTLRFFPLQNAVCSIILTYLVPVLFTFYIQGVLKLKINSGAKRLKVPVSGMYWYEHDNEPLASINGWKFLDQPTITLIKKKMTLFHEVTASVLQHKLYNRIIRKRIMHLNLYYFRKQIFF